MIDERTGPRAALVLRLSPAVMFPAHGILPTVVGLCPIQALLGDGPALPLPILPGRPAQ